MSESEDSPIVRLISVFGPTAIARQREYYMISLVI